MSKKDRKRDKKSGGSRSSRRRYQKDQLMKRVQDSQKQAEGGGLSILKPDVDVTVWRPKDGPHIIDVIPYLTGKNNVDGEKPGKVHYTFQYFIHKNIGPNKEWIICPARTWGDECPICEARAKLVEQGADYDTKIAPLNAKSRNLYNVVSYDKGEEKKGVQVWDISYHYFEKTVVALSKKPSRGGRKEKTIVFFDEEEGKSITFTIEPAKSKEDYPSFVGHSFDSRDYQIDDELLDAAHCLDEIVKRPTYKEVAKAFKGTKKNDNDNNDDDDDNDLEELLEELNDCETINELKEFVDDNDVEVEVKGKSPKVIKKTKKKIKEWLEEKLSGDDDNDNNDNNDNNDDDDDDDDDDLDKMDSEELIDFAEENDIELSKKEKRLKEKKLRKLIEKKMDGSGKKESKYTIDDIEEMNKKQLKKLIKKEGLDIDPDDADDMDDLQDMVMEELGIDDD